MDKKKQAQPKCKAPHGKGRSPVAATAGALADPLLSDDVHGTEQHHLHSHGSGCTSEAHGPGMCHGFETSKGGWTVVHDENFNLADTITPGSGEARKRREAVIALGITTSATAAVMVMEIICGWWVGSLALLSDGVHQLSDVALYLGLMISVVLSAKVGDLGSYSFGYHRSEVLGALVALLMQYFATGLLIAKALSRLAAEQPHDINGMVVFFVASISLVTNMVMLRRMSAVQGHGHSHGASDSSAVGVARLHMIGDLVQGLACVLVGGLIWMYPSCAAADSVSTFVYAIVVVLSSYTVFQDLVQVLMERVPPEIRADKMFEELAQIKGVIDIHCCHVWMLAPSKISMSAHFHIEDGMHEEVLHAAQILLKHKYGIAHSTLQISDDEDLA